MVEILFSKHRSDSEGIKYLNIFFSFQSDSFIPMLMIDPFVWNGMLKSKSSSSFFLTN